MTSGHLTSERGSLPRPRYSRAKRAAIVTACASVLTGTAMALPAATFADEAADPPPIVSLDLGGQAVDVPDVGVPLPNVELDADQLPLAPVTDALNLEVSIDTAPEAADAAPTTTEPVSDVPSEEGAEQNWGQPDPAQVEQARPISDVPSDADAAARASSGRSAPASAVAGAPAPGSRLTTASPVTAQEVAQGVLEARTQRQIEKREALRAAEALGTEKSAPAPASTDGGLGMRAPLTDLGGRAGVDTLNLASRNGPNSATGDWNLLPEVLYAVIPLLLAGAAVAAHGRRNARMTALTVGVVQRRRHASN